MVTRDELGRRIARLVALDPRVTEKRMFGGVCFLMEGRILVCARGKAGGLLVQCGAEAARDACRTPGVTQMMMRGRPAVNFVSVDDDSLDSDDGVLRWIRLAERYLATLPPAGAPANATPRDPARKGRRA